MSNIRYEFTPSDRDNFKPEFLYLTHSKFDTDWHSTPHFHPFIEILFVTSGSGTFIINEKKCAIRRGDLVIIDANNQHTEKSTSENPMEYIIVGIDNIRFKILTNDFDAERPFFPVFSLSTHYDKTFFYLDSMYKELMEKRQNYQVMVQNLLSAFIIYVMRHTELAISTENTHHYSMNKECAFVKDFIDSHFAFNINLDDLATKTFISKYHLIHSFKKSLGVSPIQYLIEKRLTEAKSLLRTTNLSITDISKDVGFSSPAHFTSRFKQSEGMSPIDYRKKNQ